MKTKTYIITLLLAIAAASACSLEKLDPATETAHAAAETGSQVLVPFTVEAGEPQTRVAMDGSTTSIVFSAGDQLLVYCWQIVEPSILTLQSGAGQRSATFTGNLVLAAGKTEADLAGKTLNASLIPQEGVSQGIFNYDSNQKRLTVDYSTKSIDSDLGALFSRTAIYQGTTKYEDKRFEFRLLTSYLKMDVNVPSEESSLARDYTVEVTADYHIPTQATNSGLGWSGTGINAAVSGIFRASSATRGTAYMAILADSSMRIEDDSVMYDEVKLQVTMDNVYKEYDLVGGVIDKQVIEPGKGYKRTVTLRDNPDQDVLLGQPASVRKRILQTYHADLNGNGYLSKYEAAQLKSCKMYGNEDLTNASFYQYFTGMTVFEEETLVSCKNMTKVFLPKYITEIGKRALEGCTKLSSIVLPMGVTSIGDYAFNNSTSLSRIVIPSGVVTIGDCAFRYCTSLTEVVFDTSAKVNMIGEAAFENCTSLEAIALPSKVTAIKDKTFNGCTSLSNVSIPNRVTSIGEKAFSGCKALTSVRVPARVTSIGASAFSGASKLETVILPTVGIQAIAQDTFNGCTSLVDIALPSDVETIGTAAFKECSSLVNITIPASVRAIGYEAFYKCESLTSVYLFPLAPPVIDYYTFWGCPNATFYVVDKDAYWDAHATWSQWYWSRIVQM